MATSGTLDFGTILNQVIADSIVNSQDSSLMARTYSILANTPGYNSAVFQLESLASEWHSTSFASGYGAMSALTIELAQSSATWWHACDSIATADGYRMSKGKGAQPEFLLLALLAVATDVASGVAAAGTTQLVKRVLTGHNATGDELGDAFFSGAGGGAGTVLGGQIGGTFGAAAGHVLWGAVKKGGN